MFILHVPSIIISISMFICFISWVMLIITAAINGTYKRYKKMIVGLEIFQFVFFVVTGALFVIIDIFNPLPTHAILPVMLNTVVGIIYIISMHVVNFKLRKHYMKLELNKMRVDDLT